MTDTNTAERDDFEKVFPLPSGCIRCGTGYASTGYSNWAAHTHCERWQGWQARASLAASAGSEPVAAYALRNLIANGSLTQAKAITALVLTAETTHPSPPEGMAGWKPIAEAPKTGHTLLLGYFNSANKWRTTRGQWMSQDYIDEYAKDPDFMEPGWHETTVEDDDGKCWPIEPTHWMPLPAPPLPASEAKEL